MTKEDFINCIKADFPDLKVQVAYMYIGNDREEETLLINNWEFGIRWSPGINKLKEEDITVLLERCRENIFYFLAKKEKPEDA
jgi:hypothetical protein